MIYNSEELSFQILSIYRFKHKDGLFNVKPRPYAALSFHLQGKASFYIAGKRMFAEEGDIVFIPADAAYEVDTLSRELVVAHLMDCSYTEPMLFSPSAPAAFRILFSDLCRAWEERHSFNLAKSMLYGIFDAMANDRETKHGRAADVGAKYMQEHFCDPSLEIGEICDLLFMSRSSMQRAFHERFGTSPKMYLGGLRMNKAVELLMKTELSVKEVAFACGFADEKFFSRAFRQKYGFPPSQLRRCFDPL